MEMYSWKEYKCVTCKELFTGDRLLKINSGWNFYVRICRECHTLLNSTVKRYDINLINLQLEKAE